MAENLPATTVERVPVACGSRGLQLTSIEEMWRFAQAVSKSGLAPKGMEKPEAILVAIQMGLEIGLSPMSALQNIAVINGRPGVFGDAALALVRGSGVCAWFEETMEGTGDNRVAVCRSQRVGDPKPRETRFSVKDAVKAELWGKGGPWKLYPDRMLQMRARGFNLRDQFPDVLKGFKTAEELRDYSDVTEAPKLEERLPSQARPAPTDGPTPEQSKLFNEYRKRLGLTPTQIDDLIAPHGSEGWGNLSTAKADEVLRYLADEWQDAQEQRAEREAVASEGTKG